MDSPDFFHRDDTDEKDSAEELSLVTVIMCARPSKPVPEHVPVRAPRVRAAGFTPSVAAAGYQTDGAPVAPPSMAPVAPPARSAHTDVTDSAVAQPLPLVCSDEQLCRMVSKKWGAPSTAGRSRSDRLILCKVPPGSDSVNGGLIENISQQLAKLRLNCSIVKSQDDLVLLSSQSDNDSRACFAAAGSLRLSTMVSAVNAESYYPCFIHINTQSSTYQGLLKAVNNAFVTPFGGLLFLNISGVSSTVPSSSQSSQLPRVVVQLRLDPKHSQTRKTMGKMEAQLVDDCWTLLDANLHKLEHTDVHVHRSCPGVGFGINLSPMGVGIRYIINVSSPAGLASTSEFYKRFLPHPSSTSEEGVEMVVYPLNHYTEFALRNANGADVRPADCDIAPCFMLSPKQVVSLGITTPIKESGWMQVVDPDGNTVNVTTPLH